MKIDDELRADIDAEMLALKRKYPEALLIAVSKIAAVTKASTIHAQSTGDIGFSLMMMDAQAYVLQTAIEHAQRQGWSPGMYLECFRDLTLHSDTLSNLANIPGDEEVEAELRKLHAGKPKQS